VGDLSWVRFYRIGIFGKTKSVPRGGAFRRALTGTRNQTRIAQSVGTCTMATQSCRDCDTPGEGNCRRCHGDGKILPDKSFGKFAAEIPCSRCKGTGACPTCGGTGVIEVARESG
jgi:DnaJ-class molecular chaperone